MTSVNWFFPLISDFIEHVESRGFKEVEPFSKGTTSLIFRAVFRDRRVVIKLQRPDSPRRNLRKEAELIKAIESFRLTPPLLEYGTFRNLEYLVREFAEGEPLLRARLKKGHLMEIALKTAALDALGLDHGQIQGGKHLIIGRDVWIIDFEKAGWRKPNNLTSAMSMIFIGRNSISERVWTTFGLDERFRKEMIEALRIYKGTGKLSPVLGLLSRL
jgi:putative serine/threonine protein kinase